MAENKPTKHEPPKSCKLRRWLFGASPSAILGRCLLGLRTGCKACKGCRANVHEIMREAFEEGLTRSERQKIKEERREVIVCDIYEETLYSLEDRDSVEVRMAKNIGLQLLRQGLIEIKRRELHKETDGRNALQYRASVQAVRPTKEE